MKIITTGSGGFVGGHLIRKLKKNFNNVQVLGLYRKNIKFKVEGVKYIKSDLNDIVSLHTILQNQNPDYIIHLAAESSVNYSWNNPANSLQNNLNIYLNILEVIRKLDLNPKILSIGSSEVYGKVTNKDLPLKEGQTLKPLNPYAVFRVAQENISKVYNQSYGFNIIMTRSFNHYGIGQDRRFFIPNLIHQAVDKETKVIKLGDLGVVRDFIYIDDVVDAYVELLFKGKKNNIYNISTGKGHKLQEILEILDKIYPIKKPIINDSALMRPSDNPVIIGDNSKIKQETSWFPKISLEQGLQRILNNIEENGN